MKDPALYRAYLTSELALLDGRRQAARDAHQARVTALDQALEREVSRHEMREAYLRAELARIAPPPPLPEIKPSWYDEERAALDAHIISEVPEATAETLDALLKAPIDEDLE